MRNPFEEPLRRSGSRGVLTASVAAVLLVGLGVSYWGLRAGWFEGWREQMTERMERDIDPEPSWLGQKIGYTDTAGANHVPPPDPNAEKLKRLEAYVFAQGQQIQAQQAELAHLKRQPPPPPPPPPAPPKPMVAVKRAPVYFVSHQDSRSGPGGTKSLRGTSASEAGETFQTNVLAAGSWIPCTVETTLSSEVQGYFTAKVRRPVYDATGTRELIPQGQTIVAKDGGASLLFGNERVPTFATSVNLPGGRSLELEQAPIMDATGTNGLTGEVDNHVWRLVWTSVLKGGLQGGQQMLQAGLQAGVGEAVGADYVVTGIATQGNQVAQQRLGRAQDTRPTVHVAAGELCNVFLPKAITVSR